MRRRPRMSVAYIVGNPFALATISIAIVRCLPYVTWRQALTHTQAGMVDCLYQLDHRCHEDQYVFQLFMVDARVPLPLHNWHIGGFRS